MYKFQELLGESEHAVVYDHPFFAGDRGYELLESFINSVKSLGHTFVPILGQK